MLEVTICKGAALMAKDKSGTSDPFVEARLGKQRFKTKVVKKSLTPEWNETFKFDHSSGSPSLSLVVYDEDKGLLGSSAEYMGSCEITVDDLQAQILKSALYSAFLWSMCQGTDFSECVPRSAAGPAPQRVVHPQV